MNSDINFYVEVLKTFLSEKFDNLKIHLIGEDIKTTNIPYIELSVLDILKEDDNKLNFKLLADFKYALGSNKEMANKFYSYLLKINTFLQEFKSEEREEKERAINIALYAENFVSQSSMYGINSQGFKEFNKRVEFTLKVRDKGGIKKWD